MRVASPAELDASNPKAFANRGLLLREQGKNSRAHRDYEKALALDPTNQFLQMEVKALADLLAESGIGAGGQPATRARGVSTAQQNASAAAAGAGEGTVDGVHRTERL